MTIRREQIVWLIGVVIIGVIIALPAIQGYKPKLETDAGLLHVMNTEYHFRVIARRAPAQKAFDAARASANRVGALMSVYLDRSQLSMFNASKAGQEIQLDDQIMDVLRASRVIYDDTDKTFDVTIQPLIQLWRTAGKNKSLPDSDALTAARAESTWADIELHDNSAIKTSDTATVNLGGIAKGYAIDKAVSAMQTCGVENAAIEIGGDLRCIGPGLDGNGWVVRVQSPFDNDVRIAGLYIRDAAVCTSGNYERQRIINGKKFSHILDPRNPTRTYSAEYPASVTVIAPDAMTADAWATALSVLGKVGLKLLNAKKHDGIEAMIVVGTSAEDCEMFSTKGYEKLLIDEK